MPIQYLIEPPNEADRPEAGWSLIIFLHGTNERGSNLKKLTRRGPLAYRADGRGIHSINEVVRHRATIHTL